LPPAKDEAVGTTTPPLFAYAPVFALTRDESVPKGIANAVPTVQSLPFNAVTPVPVEVSRAVTLTIVESSVEVAG